MAEKKEKQYVSDNARLMAEWNWEKNNELGLFPHALTCGSGKKVWWKCGRGHEWEARIDHRNNGIGCPFCSGRYAIKGENDLQTVNPGLAEEWNYEKNNGLTPMDIMPNSGKKVWWKCDKGHEWQATVAQRNYGTKCPNCNAERHTSFPEYALVYYLEKYGIEVIQSYKAQGYELDIYIPSMKIAIEYDGAYWHKNKTKKDLEKNLKCKKDGIKLYRIREGLLPLNDYSIDYIIQSNKADLSKIIQQILYDIVNIAVDIDLERDSIAIDNLRIYTEKKNSLLICNFEMAKEWDYEKNGDLTPDKIASKSGKKVWWKCKGHSYQATLANRANGKACPYCAGQKVLYGYNDLVSINPKIAKEWNYEKNKESKPENFTANSGRKVWWKCANGHDYQATIIHRNKGGGCPYCLNQKLLPGYNDLATRNPSLAQEWDCDLNKELKPTDVFPNGHQKVWWKCGKGHPSYLATLSNRNYGKGCPYCASQRVAQGQTDLQTINPIVATEWDYEKNDGLTPADFLPNSNKKVWWVCSKGHPSWLATIASRNGGMGCPYCSGKKVFQGYNDLGTINPRLAKEWNYKKNGDLKPEDFTANSGKKAWWKCSKGHDWEARIDHRNKGIGCPYCSGRYAIKGENDLQTVNPGLAEEWNYEKNNGLAPEYVLPNSRKKVWWKCAKGHEWISRIAHRNNGSGCPECARQRRINSKNKKQ